MRNKFKIFIAVLSVITISAVSFSACGVNKISNKNTQGSITTDASAENVVTQPSNSAVVIYDGNGNTGVAGVNGGASGGSYGSGSNSGSNGSGSSSGSSSSSGNSGSSSGSGSSSSNKTESTTKNAVPTNLTDSQKRQVINSAKTNNKMKTNDSELDAMVDEILAQIIKPGMSQYEQVRAVQNYLVQNMDYNAKIPEYTDADYSGVFGYDKLVVRQAKELLKTKSGTCYDFASAFMVMTRRLGFDSYKVTGKIVYKGAESFHGWDVIKINGNDYVFDPEADFRNTQRAGSKTTLFTNFCVGAGDNRRYIIGPQTAKNLFHGFKIK